MAFHSDYETITNRSSALEFFTNRKKETKDFVTYLHSNPTPNKVLYYWGEGGNGKSLFIEYLRQFFCKLVKTENDWAYINGLNDEDFITHFIYMEDYIPVVTTFLDFGIQRENYNPKDLVFALMYIRKGLACSKLSFPCFDYAVALYLFKTNRFEQNKDLFPKEVLDFIVEISLLFTEQSHILKLTKSILGVFNKYYNKSVLLASKKRKVDEKFVERINSLDPDKELFYRLPYYFASDLNQAMELNQGPKRVVLFFDTHEAFWGPERYQADHIYFERDEWLRQLIGSLELTKGIITVVAGREEPRWSEANIKYFIPSDNINKQLVGLLSDVDAREFLEKVSIKDIPTQDALLAVARVEVNQVHPFYLGLCADIILQAETYEEFLEKSQIFNWLENKKGDKARQLIDTLLKYIEIKDMDLSVKALSLARTFDFELYEEIAKRLKLLYSSSSFDSIVSFSFVKKTKINGRIIYKTHNLLRKILNEQIGEFRNKVHEELKSYFQEIGKRGDNYAIAEAIYHRNQISWEEGAAEWCEVFERALRQYDFQLCAILHDLSFDLKVEDNYYPYHFAYCRGKYLSVIAKHDEAIKELLFSIQQINIIISGDTLNLENNNYKGNSYIALGDLHVDINNRPKALKYYTLALESYDKALLLARNFNSTHNIGNYLQNQGKQESDITKQRWVLQYYVQVTELDKGTALQRIGELQADLSNHQQALENYTQAIEAYNKSLLVDPNYVKAYINKGNTFGRMGDAQARLNKHQQALDYYTLAIETYKKALSLDADNIFTFNNKGNALQSMGDLQSSLSQHQQALKSYFQAIIDYDKALSLAPNYINAYFNKGNALRSLGELQVNLSQPPQALKSYAQAIEAYNKALSLAPNHVNAHNNKGSVLSKQGELQIDLTQHQQALGSYTLAIEAYDSALSFVPNYADFHKNKGRVLNELGDLLVVLNLNQQALESYTRSIEFYNKVLSLDPNDINAGTIKGSILNKQGNMQVSLNQYPQALESYTLAIETFDKVLSQAPNHAYEYNNKACVLCELGDLQADLGQDQEALKSYTMAIEAYNDSLKLEPDNVKNVKTYNNKGTILDRLGELHVRLDQYTKALDSYTLAIEEFDKALSLSQNDISYFNKGNVLASLGDIQAEFSQHQKEIEFYIMAIEAYDNALSLVPNNFNAYKNKGNTLLSMANLLVDFQLHQQSLEYYLQAFESYEKILSLDPDDINAHNNIGVVMAGIGYVQAILNQHQHALEFYTRAVECYNKALSLDQNYINSYFNKGNALQRLGNLYDKLLQKQRALKSYYLAIEAYDNVMRLSPDNLKAKTERERVTRKLQNFSE
ncbi:MAG: tetratricopeptide repeat protein [Desulfosporosinus sp.]|nr:tetratricopeptide repeat protein [Desulfosporosinus sp.]